MSRDYVKNIIIIIVGLLLKLIGLIGITIYIVLIKNQTSDIKNSSMMALISISLIIILSGALMTVSSTIMMVIKKIKDCKKQTNITLYQDGEGIYLLENK